MKKIVKILALVAAVFAVSATFTGCGMIFDAVSGLFGGLSGKTYTASEYQDNGDTYQTTCTLKFKKETFELTVSGSSDLNVTGTYEYSDDHLTLIPDSGSNYSNLSVGVIGDHAYSIYVFGTAYSSASGNHSLTWNFYKD